MYNEKLLHCNTVQLHQNVAWNSPDSCMRQSHVGCNTGSTTGLRQALLIGFANRLARRMTTHNGYKTLSDPPTLAQLHPSTARIAADEDGLLPEWVIYHELISTAKVFLSRVRFCQSATVACPLNACCLSKCMYGQSRRLQLDIFRMLVRYLFVRILARVSAISLHIIRSHSSHVSP